MLRRSATTLVTAALVLLALDSEPATACSMTGRLNQLHESLDGSRVWLSQGPSLGDARYWFGIERAGTGEYGEQIAAPRLTEGYPTLIAVLDDGRTWWRVACSDDQPPQSATCNALILISPEGEVLSRVANDFEFDLHGGEIWSDPTGTLWLLPHRGLPGIRQELERSTLALYRAVPEPISAWQPNQDLDAWRARQEASWAGLLSPENEGWIQEWQVPWPTAPLEGQATDPSWAINGHLLASLQTNDSLVEVGVFELDLSGQEPRWHTRWHHTWPYAQDGEPRSADGQLALAAGRITVSPSGQVVLGPWRYRPDCSFEREGGAVLFDASGEPLREIEAASDLYGTGFNEEGELIVTGSDGRRIFDAAGEHVRTGPLRGIATTEEVRRRAAVRRTLHEGSTATEFLEAIGPGDITWLERPLLDLSGDAQVRIIEAWPAIDRLVSDRLWIQLSPDLCAKDRAAGAQLALARFRRAEVNRRVELLDGLPECLPHPPPDVLEWVTELAGRRGWGMKQAAEKALSRWREFEGAGGSHSRLCRAGQVLCIARVEVASSHTASGAPRTSHRNSMS